MRGSRIYLKNITVNQVKRAVGLLAKKIQLAPNGEVEVIHTYNGHGRASNIFYSIIGYLDCQYGRNPYDRRHYQRLEKQKKQKDWIKILVNGK